MFDKYGYPYLTYEYENGKLIRVIYRKELINNSVYDKVIEFSYNTSSQIISMSYKYKNIEKCKSNFVYTNNSLTSIEHYSGVDYLFSFSDETFTAKSANHGEAFSNDYGHQIIATGSDGNIQIESKIGAKTVSRNTYYGFLTSSEGNERWNKYDILDITDMHGVKTRVQFENKKPRYSYDVTTDDTTTDDITTSHFIKYINNYTYNSNVSIYSNNQIAGSQTYDDGKKMTYHTDHSWSLSSVPEELPGYFTLSGWVRTSDINLICEMQIYDRSQTTAINFRINNIIRGRWFFFTYTLKNIGYSEINIKTSCSSDQLEMRDFRITYQESKVMAEDDENNLITMEDVLITDSGEIPLNDVTFYLGSNALSKDTYKFKTSDIVRYQINQKSNKNTNEIYYNDCKNVMISTEDLRVLYDGISIPTKVIFCIFGTKYYQGVRTRVTKTDTTSIYYFLTVDSTMNGDVISSEIINNKFDVTTASKGDIVTVYNRNSRGLLATQTISGLAEKRFTYNEVSSQLLSSTDEFGTVTTYTTDDVWGIVTIASVSDGTSTTDEYDADMTDKVSKTFAKNTSNKKHSYSYTNGNLTGITHSTLNYNFAYTNGDLTEVKKFGRVIENHVLSNEDKTLTSSYPSSASPLYTVESTVDKYGKLTGVTGQYSNTYDIAPYYSLNQYRTIGGNGANDLLSATTDLITGNKTRYGYTHNILEKVGVFNSSDTKISEQSFTYDDIKRVISDKFVYDYSGSNYAIGDIEYQTEATASNPDNRIKTYSYKLNGTEKVKTQNRFIDGYKRLTAKLITLSNATFEKAIYYDKTRVSRVLDVRNGATIHNVLYEYDIFGRIISEKNSASDTTPTTYMYDSFGQLIRENNKALDKTLIYGYDSIGNITSIKTYGYTTGTVIGTPTEETFTYNTTYKDRFRKIGSYSVTYNTDGCLTKVTVGLTPISYTWDKGRLASVLYSDLTNGSKRYSFTYDGYGRRISKSYTFTVGSTVPSSYIASAITNYTYDTKGRLIKENYTATSNTSSTTTKEIMYLYDESSIVGIIYTVNGTSATYYLDKNIKGDVLRIYGSTGNVVAEYGYDAYGNCTILSSTNADLASFNPIRYRGYYYDTETGMYFLNSRYYNPAWRRFISPDSTEYLDPESVNGLNLYAYCYNDPVNFSDPSGNFAISLTMLGLIAGAAIGATVGGIAAYNIAKDNGSEGWDLFGWTMVGALGGGIVGAAAGAGIGALVTKATGVVGLSITKYSIVPVKSITVLGHDPGYMAIAKSVKAGFYRIKDSLYDDLLAKGLEWTNNMQYLRDANALGSYFVLSPDYVVLQNGTLWKEIQYLISNNIPWIMP